MDLLATIPISPPASQQTLGTNPISTLASPQTEPTQPGPIESQDDTVQVVSCVNLEGINKSNSTV